MAVKEDPTNRWVTDRLMLAAYGAGFTLAEVGQRFGGLTRERVRQRLAALPGYAPRRGAPKRAPLMPAWQARFAQELCDTGANKTTILWLLSISEGVGGRIQSKTNRGSSAACGERFRSNDVNEIFVGLKSSILIHAWRNGATIEDLALIFTTTTSWIATWMGRLRAAGYDLPLRKPFGWTEKTP